jgi:cytochrome c-type biogenesis protein CcsB
MPHSQQAVMTERPTGEGAGLWRAIGLYVLAVLLVSLAGVSLYEAGAGPAIQQAQDSFFLKYLLESRSAIMWMNALFVGATLLYWAYVIRPGEFLGQVATAVTWVASVMGMAGLGVRWRETYLAGPGWGHIPVSNLYEVVVLFCALTAFMYLLMERKYGIKTLGAFVLTVITAAVSFILWYQFARAGAEIEPLVPALQSYWMKIHVPANFVGYGAFAISFGAAVMYLIRDRAERAGKTDAFSVRAFPSLEILDDLSYKAIAVGFPIFVLATILGAAWAAEAWGGYWSWDPKETWALIVLLIYAGYLHARMTKGWRGRKLAWWSVVGFGATVFCFFGVNMFLSGLHSYGEL